MSQESREPAGGGRGVQRGLPEALRAAVDRTLAATAGPAAETRERAQELLDEAVRRGQEARESLGRRLGSGEEAATLAERLDRIERRLAAIERAVAKSNSKAEG